MQILAENLFIYKNYYIPMVTFESRYMENDKVGV